jgi:YHS domain-containing protein
MRRVLILALYAAIGLLTVSAIGCGEKGNSDQQATGKPTMAYEFRDDAPKYYSQQRTCPVCGGQPIKEDVHVTHQGKRIYFDKEECATEFEENPEKYIQQWTERMREREAKESKKMNEASQ